MKLEFHGVHAEILADRIAERDIEGSLSCGKTTLCLWDELEQLKKHPGIWILLSRWTEDATKTLLRPAFEQLARIHGSTWSWNRDENYYTFENGSRAYSFGLKTQSSDPEQRYGKIRGLPVSRIYVDQAEQLPADIANELRARLRPDIEARLKGIDYPRQLTFSPNPVNDSHWIAKQFPLDNKLKGRHYYGLSLFDNKHNLPADMIEGLLRAYPAEHPKHQTVILGQRGLNVIGEGVYENLFDRTLHVKAVEANHDAPLLEGFEVGKHNPVWIAAQRTYAGGLVLLGGIIGKRMMLDDFLPLVQRTRTEWWPELKTVKSCTSPMGETSGSARYTLVNLLRDAGLAPIWRENANAHDVQLAMIEQTAALLRRRLSAKEEAVAISNAPDRWLSVLPDGSLKATPFLSFAFEGGYVWSEHMVSVSNKTMRQPFVDDEYSNAMRCVENILLNFFAGQKTDAQQEAERYAEAQRQGPTSGFLDGPHGWLSF
jgi:hypothetical protein